jgi:5-dehydro-4-deoxyglucarate dehydratase
VNHKEFASSLRGVFGFPVTPFNKDLSLDLKGLARNVDEMAAHPFCAMVAAGGTGELYSLSIDEIEAVVRTTVEAVNGRMPIVAGTGFNMPMGVEISKRLEKAGADCILVLPPYYSHSPLEGVVEFYEAIGKATGLPLMIYSRDWAAFTPQQVARIADRVPSLVCWKDGQGDVRKYQRIMNYMGDRLAWIGGLGDDCIPGYFAIGVQAYTSSISNVAPKLSIELAQAGVARDFARIDKLMMQYVQPLYAVRERHRGYEVAVMKEMMDQMGLAGGPVRPPLMNVREHDMNDIRALVEIYQEVR